MSESGQIETSLSAFERAVQVDPQFADAHFRIGKCYEAMGEGEKARKKYEMTVVLLPNHVEAKAELARREP